MDGGDKMEAKRCCICGNLIDENNRSEEHIIHNGIGGWLKDDGIYCKECNSSYGTELDIDFIKMFAPVVDNLDIRIERKTKGTSYEAYAVNKKGERFIATVKNKRIVEVKNIDGDYVSNRLKEDMQIEDFLFNIDNDVLKRGIVKIAFNYAIHNGINPRDLEQIYDLNARTLMDDCCVIPFVPLTLFDWLIEQTELDNIFHAVRIFSKRNLLYAYVELFGTFQYYVLLSKSNKKEIDIYYSNYICKYNNTSEQIIIKDYKDCMIICNQYRIDIDEVLIDLKKYHNYDFLEYDDQMELLFKTIGKKANEQYRKRTYNVDYNRILDEIYKSVEFVDALKGVDNRELAAEFIEAFQFYTCYDTDTVNVKNYKVNTSKGELYPQVIYRLISENKIDFKTYEKIKFKQLKNRLKRIEV